MVRREVLRRWSVPAAALAVSAGVAVGPHAFAASAHPKLPPRSAAALIAAVEQSRVQALTGTVQTTADLGLPQLPDSISGGGAGLQAMLTGTQKLRLWVDGAQRQRIALLGDLAETDVVHNVADLWTYTSRTNTVTHQHFGGGTTAASDSADTGTPAQQLTPQAQARKFLHAIDPSTRVTVDRTARVAGRAAYQLVLAPRTSATLIRSVRIAIDAATALPLRVQVFAAGSKSPAFQTGFTSLSLHRPAASVFAFRTPPSAHVSRSMAEALGVPGAGASPAGPPDTARPKANGKPRVVGRGWASIAVLPAGTVDQSSATNGSQKDGSGSILDAVTKPVAQGRLLTTRLLSLLITPDGRVLVGAVPATALERAAGA
ncbi:MAG: hypothetical protein JO222_12990 [Frankiales bacterium]|nr:hypothetical protein [Frankiales bacterium]